jgi:hypothetical protein
VMKLLFGNKEFHPDTATALLEILQQLKQHEEIWLSGHGETSLLVLLNAQSALALYFKSEDGDESFHTLDLSKDNTQQEEFLLCNGQADVYPQHFLRTREEGIAALVYYFNTGEMNPAIDWISQEEKLL